MMLKINYYSISTSRNDADHSIFIFFCSLLLYLIYKIWFDVPLKNSFNVWLILSFSLYKLKKIFF